MPLTEQQKLDIQQDEAFRQEVRTQLGPGKRPATLLDRVSAFGESKVGFWLIATVLAGSLSSVYGAVQRYLDRDRIAASEARERKQHDVDLVMKLSPMLTSSNQPVVAAGVHVLEELARTEAVDRSLARILIENLLASTVAAAKQPEATPEARMRAETVLALTTDAGRLSEIQGAPAVDAPAPAVRDAIQGNALPARVYIQVGSDEDREPARAMTPALHQAGFLVPGVEKVRSVPDAPEIRYCEGKVDPGHPQSLAQAVDPFFVQKVKLLVLPASLCTRVRQNHFELWLPKRG